MSDPILELNALEKTYHRDRPNQINVLCGANLEVKPGEIIALVAPSGAGKSTLLHIAGLLDTPDEGEVKFNGEILNKLSDRKRTAIRRHQIGFISVPSFITRIFRLRKCYAAPTGKWSIQS